MYNYKKCKIMKGKINRLTLLLALMLPTLAHAISGHYNDAGGGNYWCNVQRMTSVNDNAASIHLGHVSAGVYFIEAITIDGHRVVKQIIKQS